MPCFPNASVKQKHGGSQRYEQTDSKKRARGSRTVDVFKGGRLGSQCALDNSQQPADVYGECGHRDDVAVARNPGHSACGSCSNHTGMGDRNEETLGMGGCSCSVVFIQRRSERLAAAHAWMANASAHTRLHRDTDTGDHPDISVSRRWRMADETFRVSVANEALSCCRHVTAMKMASPYTRNQ
jgi:hypothetical protein